MICLNNIFYQFLWELTLTQKVNIHVFYFILAYVLNYCLWLMHVCVVRPFCIIIPEPTQKSQITKKAGSAEATRYPLVWRSWALHCPLVWFSPQSSTPLC